MKMDVSSRQGIEITVLFDGFIVSSRWFSMPAVLSAGDGPGFPVFFPWRVWDNLDITDAQTAGYELRPVRNVHAVGATFLVPTSDGRMSLILPAQIRARLNNTEMPVCEQITKMELTFPFSGEIQGATAWTLRFQGENIPKTHFATPFRPNFFTQAVLFGCVAMFGGILAAFNAPSWPTLEEWETPVRSRLAMIQWVTPQERKKPDVLPVEEDTVQSRLVQLRTARTVRPPRPQPQMEKTVLQLRTMTSRNMIKMPHEEHVIDLTDLDTPTADEPEITLDLGSSGAIHTPIVVPTPVTQPLTTPPPPMAVARPSDKPTEATPARRISFPRVEYPESARHLGIEGKVRLRLYIDEKGKITKVEIIQSLHPLLDQAASAAAKEAQYEPARDHHGRPMATTAIVTVRFELEEE